MVVVLTSDVTMGRRGPRICVLPYNCKGTCNKLHNNFYLKTTSKKNTYCFSKAIAQRRVDRVYKNKTPVRRLG